MGRSSRSAPRPEVPELESDRLPVLESDRLDNRDLRKLLGLFGLVLFDRLRCWSGDNEHVGEPILQSLKCAL